MNIHISFTAETIFSFLGINVTNSVITAFIAFAFVVIGIVIVKGSLNSFKPGSLEIVIEMIYEQLNQLAEDILGKVNARKFLAFLLTFFVFILISNWIELLPIVPSVGFLKADSVTANSVEFKKPDNLSCLITGSCYLSTAGIVNSAEFTPILRAPTADLSSGLAFALISVVVTNVVGFAAHRLKYLKKYLDFSNPLNFVIGLFESISEVGRILSFSFRLFGNIFAGEVLLAVITALTFGLATVLPFGMELFVGLIQALVFFLLTTVFISMAIDHH